MQHHLDVIYTDSKSRSLEAEQTWKYVDTDDDSEDESLDSTALSDTELNDENSGVDTMEHMSGKLQAFHYSPIDCGVPNFDQ